MLTITDEAIAPLALCPRDAAKSLAISERTLWAKTKDGTIPHRRIGTRVVYPVRLLQEWLESQSA
jgi:excisionase family DNA binding protein